MPVIDPGKGWPPHRLKEQATQSGTNLMPLVCSAGGYSYLRAADGFGIFRDRGRNDEHSQTDSIEIHSVVFAFETGEVWSIEAAWLAYGEGRFPFVETDFVGALRGYARFLQGLGLAPPYRWIAGIAGTKGRHFDHP